MGMCVCVCVQVSNGLPFVCHTQMIQFHWNSLLLKSLDIHIFINNWNVIVQQCDAAGQDTWFNDAAEERSECVCVCATSKSISIRCEQANDDASLIEGGQRVRVTPARCWCPSHLSLSLSVIPSLHPSTFLCSGVQLRRVFQRGAVSGGVHPAVWLSRWLQRAQLPVWWVQEPLVLICCLSGVCVIQTITLFFCLALYFCLFLAFYLFFCHPFSLTHIHSWATCTVRKMPEVGVADSSV